MIIQRLLFCGAILSALGAYGLSKSKDKDAKKNSLLCLGLAFILGFTGYNISDKSGKIDSGFSQGQQITFKGHIEEYSYEYTLPAYDGRGNYVCDVVMKSKGGYLYAFPNNSSHSVNYWTAPYNAPYACTYSCVWGGGYIYF